MRPEGSFQTCNHMKWHPGLPSYYRKRSFFKKTQAGSVKMRRWGFVIYYVPSIHTGNLLAITSQCVNGGQGNPMQAGEMQSRDVHICPLGQVWPHTPQLVRSTSVFTHAPLHDVRPVAHEPWDPLAIAGLPVVPLPSAALAAAAPLAPAGLPVPLPAVPPAVSPVSFATSLFFPTSSQWFTLHH
jgi:hypothetical protein